MGPRTKNSINAVNLPLFRCNTDNMQKIYSKDPKHCKLVTAKPTTVDFLLNYSKSLHISKVKGLTVESILN